MRSAEEVALASGRNLKALHEKLLALRLDLVHGVTPRAERITLTAGDLEYLLVQLDAAIAFTRDMAFRSSWTCRAVAGRPYPK